MIDTVATMQGVIDAHEKGILSKELYDGIMSDIRKISIVPQTGVIHRREMDYKKFIHILSCIEAPRSELICLWTYLGHSISSGISVSDYDRSVKGLSQ
jgi:hypothetical protein